MSHSAATPTQPSTHPDEFSRMRFAADDAIRDERRSALLTDFDAEVRRALASVQAKVA